MGLVNSKAFVPLLSREAINHPDKDWENFSKLTEDSNCDNVYLEHRLALELQGLGMIEKIFPVFIGDLDKASNSYSDFFTSGCCPVLPNVTVKKVEEKLQHHMENQALGTPLEPDRSVVSVVNAIKACQGAFIKGDADTAFAACVNGIVKMLEEKVKPEQKETEGKELQKVQRRNSALSQETEKLTEEKRHSVAMSGEEMRLLEGNNEEVKEDIEDKELSNERNEVQNMVGFDTPAYIYTHV